MTRPVNAELAKSPVRGVLFEGLVASELVKQQANAVSQREAWWFRDQQGLEVDFVVPTKGGGLRLLEAKAGSGLRPEAEVPMQRLAAAIARSDRRGKAEMAVVYESAKPVSRFVAEGVRAVGWRELSQI